MKAALKGYSPSDVLWAGALPFLLKGGADGIKDFFERITAIVRPIRHNIQIKAFTDDCFLSVRTGIIKTRRAVELSNLAFDRLTASLKRGSLRCGQVLSC